MIDKDLVAVKLGPELRQTAVASPDYLARHGTPAHPRDLLAHRGIGWRWPGQKTPYKWQFMENGKWFEVGIAFASQQLIARQSPRAAWSRCSNPGRRHFPATIYAIRHSGGWRRPFAP